MQRLQIAVLLLVGVALLPTDDLCAELLIAKRKLKTPLSTRIWGRWELNKELTADLFGRKSTLSAFAVAEFEREKIDLNTVTKKYADRFKEIDFDARLYETGVITWAGKKYPFALASVEGATVLYYFREVEGEPFGRLESRFISLAIGAEPDRDMLFFGGTQASHKFMVYRRITGPDETNSTEKKTVE